MVKRLLGPLLIVALGVAFLFGLGGQAPAGAANVSPCTTLPTGVVSPCGPTTTVCVQVDPIPGLPDSCATTTTEVKATTTASTAPKSTTTAPKSTTTAPNSTPTTGDSAVLPANVAKTTSAGAPAVGQLARTGSNNGPLTGLGIALVLLGFGLLVTSTRLHHRRTQA